MTARDETREKEPATTHPTHQPGRPAEIRSDAPHRAPATALRPASAARHNRSGAGARWGAEPQPDGWLWMLAQSGVPGRQFLGAC